MAKRSEPPTPFAKLLVHYREAFGYTQETLADRISQKASFQDGLTVAAIKALESGQRKAPRRSTVELLANAFNLTGADRDRFFWEADRLRVRRRPADETPFTATGDASQYFPRATPTDATAAEIYGPPADEGLLPMPECFVGREHELNWLTDHLRRGVTTGITAVQGIGGIGKTSLAAMAIHALRAEGRFTGGVGVNICQGKSDTIQVIREVLSRFEPQRRLPHDNELPQLYDTAERLLGGKDTLIVLDNVEPELDIEMVVKPLQAARSAVLLTSRAYLPVGETLDLRLLTTEQAQELFWSYYAVPPVDKDSVENSAAVVQIVENLGNHTLAVKVAAHYAFKARRRLKILADELSTPHEVETITEAVHRIFRHSYDALPQRSQQLFAALAAFETAEFSRNAAIALAKSLGLPQPSGCVDDLIGRALIEPAELDGLPPGSDVERLRLHPLLQAFAIEKLAQCPAEFSIQSRRALAAYYADYASRPLRVALGPDERNITSALLCACEHQLDDLVAKICLGMQAFWRDYGRADKTAEFVPRGIAAAEQIASATDAQEAHLSLATLRLAYVHYLRLTGKLGEAERLAQLVLPTFRGAENLRGTASTLTALGNIARDKGEYDQSRAYLREALSIFQSDQVQDQAGQGLALCFLGQVSQRLGEIETSEQELQHSLKLYREVQDQWGIGLALLLLGRNSIQKGRFQEADARYQEALGIHQKLEARRSIGAGLSSLGEIALNLGNLAEAEQYFRQSLKARRESRDRRGEAVDYTFLGRLTAIEERFDESARYLEDALTIWKEVQDPRGKGWLLSEQAQFALDCGKLDEANSLLTRSLEIRRQVGDRRGEAIDLRVAAEVALIREDLATAADLLEHAESLATDVEDRPEQARIRLVRGKVAAKQGNLDRAELLFHSSLTLASDLGIRREMAQAQACLGAFLMGQCKIRDGCGMISNAVANYARTGIPIPEKTHQLMVEFGCAKDE